MFSVGTANTFEGSLLTDPEGLTPFEEREVDVLLLQEVFEIAPEALSHRLERHGYGIVHYAGELGLAIAMRQFASSDILGFSQSYDKRLLTPNAPERLIGKALKSNRVHDRGMVATNLRFVNYTEVGLVTTHPIVFTRPRSRRKHIEALGAVLARRYADKPLIVAGDMNHFPVPRGIDEQFRISQRLERATLNEPTWLIKGSKHEWLAGPLAAISGRVIEAYNAQLDAVLYRGLRLAGVEVVPVASDHRAVVAQFEPPGY